MGGIIFLIFIILFMMFLFGLFSIAEGQSGRSAPQQRTRSYPSTPPASRRSARVNTAAKDAMRRAGYAADNAYVNVTDIGLLAYRETDDPRLVRYNEVWADTDYLRPFVVLSVPHQARGMVRLEISDDEDRVRYADETRYDLQPGENTLLPGTWLPLRGKSLPTEPWTLNVTVGETLLAAYQFGWQEVGGELQQYIEADGEISPELQQALRERSDQAMSLSQLLSDQEN